MITQLVISTYIDVSIGSLLQQLNSFLKKAADGGSNVDVSKHCKLCNHNYCLNNVDILLTNITFRQNNVLALPWQCLNFGNCYASSVSLIICLSFLFPSPKW